ncbi:hypothetical protein COU76_02325 [Candidatus Peregrinibacteria bacterium CG10_big_fil_rev_8_21_14_0_10_49_10]|nr:MAG: hypothetical protein COU76_02325 [Candidatus Peregrinibacteria bacterium CG10_big_fil_rev_8_21_14_0_10_49_10]
MAASFFMSTRTFIIGLLAVGINFSACSALALTSLFLLPTRSVAAENILMTPSQMSFSCEKQSSHTALDVHTQRTGCRDTKACIQNSIHAEVHRGLHASAHTQNLLVFLQTPCPGKRSMNTAQTESVSLARDGPLYPEAPLFAHQLMKRE